MDDKDLAELNIFEYFLNIMGICSIYLWTHMNTEIVLELASNCIKSVKNWNKIQFCRDCQQWR